MWSLFLRLLELIEKMLKDDFLIRYFNFNHQHLKNKLVELVKA